jgi:hypothetical protein
VDIPLRVQLLFTVFDGKRCKYHNFDGWDVLSVICQIVYEKSYAGRRRWKQLASSDISAEISNRNKAVT